jgi:hypothetical protein
MTSVQTTTQLHLAAEALAKQQRMDTEALWTLALARLAVSVLKFEQVAAMLGHFGQETPKTPVPKPELALAVSWAVQSVAKTVPWRCECLEQALCAKWMLRKRKLPSTLYFGTFYNGHGLEAHAWVRCGLQIITGERGHQQFTITAINGDKITP